MIKSCASTAWCAASPFLDFELEGRNLLPEGPALSRAADGGGNKSSAILFFSERLL